jgi:hypothetical protein
MVCCSNCDRRLYFTQNATIFVFSWVQGQQFVRTFVEWARSVYEHDACARSPGNRRTGCPRRVAALLRAAWALAGLVRSQLYGITPNDPASMAGAALTLALVAAIAGCVPAARAARIDPMRVLRCE